MKKLRALYVIGSMGNGCAGTEKNLLTIIEHLDKATFEPILITLQDCDYFRAGKFVCETHCWHVDQMFTLDMFAKRKKLAELMRRRAIDVVQTFFVEGHLVGGGAARMAGIKAIVSSRRNLGYSYGFKEKLFLQVANRYPRRWLANSEAVAREISSIEGLDRGRFDVIYNGVEMKAALPVDQHLPQFIALVANLRPVKAIPTLVRAAVEVVREFPQARFRIIGEGPDRHSLQALINRVGLHSNFEMPGSTYDVHAAIANATMGVLTSTSEGFSNSLLEYMRAALPVIATNVGGNTEIVQEGATGFLIDAGDHQKLAGRIVELLRNPPMVRRMGTAGRKLVEEKFSLSGMVRKHEDYYRKIVSEAELQPGRGPI